MTEIVYWFQTIVGIGLLIFFHELGHFMAARWSKVRVEAFSLGFGPVLLKRQKGPTEYRLSAIPLGGYVKLAGETPSDEKTGAPDELSSKSVGVRAFIFSAGVIMNLLLALILFPLLFYSGVSFIEPVIGTVTPGGPAWRAGLEPGTKILAVDGSPVFGFEHIASGVALGSEEGISLRIETPDGEIENVLLTPALSPNTGYPAIFVGPAYDADLTLEIDPKGPAFAAGLRSGDRVVRVDGKEVSGQNAEPLLETLQRTEKAQISAVRDGQPLDFEVEPVPFSGIPKQLGIAPIIRKIVSIRPHPVVTPLRLEEGDLLISVDSKAVYQPSDLRELLVPGKVAQLEFRRDVRTVNMVFSVVDGSYRDAFINNIAFGSDFSTNRILTFPGRPAHEAGLRDGDEILEVASQATGAWKEIRKTILAQEEGPVAVVYRSADTKETESGGTLVHIVPQHPPTFGMQLKPRYWEYKTGNVLEAVTVGTQCAVKMVQDIVLTLGKIVSNKISADNLGGILTIGDTAIRVSQEGFSRFLFFLALLSVNLAFLNILPIPVLDGGHLFFLLIEAIRGKPVSERTLGYAQFTGLVFLLGLIVFVTYNDIRRLFF